MAKNKSEYQKSITEIIFGNLYRSIQKDINYDFLLFDYQCVNIRLAFTPDFCRFTLKILSLVIKPYQ